MKTLPVLAVSLLAWSAACADSLGPPPARGSAADLNDAGVHPVIVTLNPFSARLATGNSLAFRPVVWGRYGYETWPATGTWSSSDPAIARVSAEGVVTAVAPGEATITAACPGGIDQATVTVVEPGASPFNGTRTWSFVLLSMGLAPLYDVWGSSTTDVFAVGSTMLWDCCGAIMHYDGTTWSYMDVPADLGEVTGVWGSSATDVYAVERNWVLHYDGAGWSRVPTPAYSPLEAVWGSSATDVYVVGWQGLMLHYDGSAWKQVPTSLGTGDALLLTDIWGTSARDVFAVGSGILHYDGASWKQMPTPPFPGLLLGVWGSAADDVFAVGSTSVILHYDGSSWTRQPTPPRDGDLLGIWGSSGSDVFAVGDRHWWGPEGCCSDVLHYDGTSWKAEPGMSGQALFDVWTTADQAFIVGAGPTIIHGLR